MFFKTLKIAGGLRFVIIFQKKKRTPARQIQREAYKRFPSEDENLLNFSTDMDLENRDWFQEK